RDIGSNNFAVAAAHGAQGRAIVANDMHLDLRVPGTWFKARMQWQDAAGRHDIAGVTLPRTPLLVVGSNGPVAWGLTNTTANW
ncbi:penicillin acylase family protein, partial [Escherichia coli]|uniref:penicillin acylase family protein n=1 Tax=Escherichia coli TaxID=562 RepID=UPI001174F2C9